MSDLAELLERVKAATGPDRELDGRLDGLVDHEGEAWPAAYTASIDAALALTERMLPGWDDVQEQVGGVYYAVILDRFKRQEPATGEGANRPLAILAALLSALVTQEPQP